MKNIYILYFFVFLIASCKIDPETPDLEKGFVNGIVLDKTTNTGIAGATVYLLGNEGGGTWGGGGTPSFEIDQTISDSNGNFLFTFDYSNSTAYYCSAIATQYFNYNDEFLVDDNVAGVNNVEVELQPIGYLQIHFLNILPSSTSDNFGINGYVTDNFYGADVDTTITYAVSGNNWNTFYWAEGYEPTSGDTVYCPSFDTTYFEILY